MQFHTKVALPPQTIQIHPQSKVLFIGSCFAEHIGKKMTDALPDGHCQTNPFGVLYNPESTAQALWDIMDPKFDTKTEDFFMTREQLWRHWHCSTLFSGNSLEECKEKVCNAWLNARNLFLQRPLVIVTWSTCHVFRINGRTVANCHKEPASQFEEYNLTAEEIISQWEILAKELAKLNIYLILTLSPYRYLKWGLSENAVSKAHLRIAIDELSKRHNNVFYFPAYEIVIDELRDYRFYDCDMLHPSRQATDYVWERFREWAFTSQALKFSEEKEGILCDLRHKPLHPESEAHQLFLARCEERRKLFIRKWGTW